MLRMTSKERRMQFVYVDTFSKNKYEFVSSTDLLKMTSRLDKGKTKYFVEEKQIATLVSMQEGVRRARKKENEKLYLATAKTIKEEHIQTFKQNQLYFDSVDQNGLHAEVPTILMKREDYPSKKMIVINDKALKVTTGHVLTTRYNRQILKKTIKKLKKADEAKSKAQPEVTLEVPLTTPQQEQKAEVRIAKPKRKTKRKAQDALKPPEQQELINALLNKRQIIYQNLYSTIPLFHQHKLRCALLILSSSSIDDIYAYISEPLCVLRKAEKDINDSIDEYNELSHLLGVQGGHFTKVTADNDTTRLQSPVLVPSFPIASSSVYTTPLVVVEEAKEAASTSSHEPELLSQEECDRLAKLSKDIEPIINPPSQIKVSHNPHAFFSTDNDFTALCLTGDSIPLKSQQKPG